MFEIKQKIKTALKSSTVGEEFLFHFKKFTNRLPIPDMNFPELISLEIASSCNLSCIHCPPHMREFKDKVSWYEISWNQKLSLSESFIREFKDKVDLEYMLRDNSITQELYDELIPLEK